jgi:alpha-tubulin suppressor-like RCC1 family protein
MVRVMLILVLGLPGPVAAGELMREPAADVSEQASMVSGGRGHTCAVVRGGGVKCWGGNWSGQLGNGTTIDHSNIPVDVVGLSGGASTVSAGNGHSCVLTMAGGVKCWGSNDYGQLGDGTRTNRNSPVDVVRLPGRISSVSAGYSHTCALTVGGGVKCWGKNYWGQLGDGRGTTPLDVVGLGGIVYMTVRYLPYVGIR